MTPEEAKVLATEVVEKKSRSYVQAAQTLATFILSTYALSKEAAEMPGAAWENRPSAMRSTPAKTHAWLAAFAMRDDAAEHLAELLDATTKNTVELCAAAIRQRATYLAMHYQPGVSDQVRHVAYWLESEAGIECMAAIDEALPSGFTEKKT